MMRFEWDERKRRSNLEKHDLDFLDVSAVFDAPPIVVPSADNSDEERFLAIGAGEGRCVTDLLQAYHAEPPPVPLRFSLIYKKANGRKWPVSTKTIFY